MVDKVTVYINGDHWLGYLDEQGHMDDISIPFISSSARLLHMAIIFDSVTEQLADVAIDTAVIGQDLDAIIMLTNGSVMQVSRAIKTNGLTYHGLLRYLMLVTAGEFDDVSVGDIVTFTPSTQLPPNITVVCSPVAGGTFEYDLNWPVVGRLLSVHAENYVFKQWNILRNGVALTPITNNPMELFLNDYGDYTTIITAVFEYVQPPPSNAIDLGVIIPFMMVIMFMKLMMSTIGSVTSNKLVVR